MALELNDAGTPRLAVSAGTAMRGAALTRILALRASPGWIAGPTGVREWRWEGVIEREGTVWLVGRNVQGISLEKVLALSAGVSLPLIARLVRALLQLSESSAGWFPLQSDSVIFTDAGGVLILPPAVDRELRSLRPFESNRDTYECLNHPDLHGESLAGFTVCAALFRILTGRFPFQGSDPEELHAHERNLDVQSPAHLVPGLDEEASELVMAGLCRGHRAPPSLREMSERLALWQARELVHPLTDQEREAALLAAGSREQAAERSFRRRRFWLRNWKVAAVAAAGALVLGALGGTILKNALAPRVTRGFSPRKVVEAFYTSMNSLDHATMQACVVGRTGRGEIDETTTLYVTSRVTQGYEGRSNIVSAADWDKAGRRPLVPPQTLYGVTALSLVEERGEPDPVFLVKYEKWSPAPPAETDSATDAIPRSAGHAVTDHVWMKRDRGDWVIFRIDRLEAREIPGPRWKAAQPLGRQ